MPFRLWPRRWATPSPLEAAGHWLAKPADVDAGQAPRRWLDDAFGPDRIRVSFAVEPAVNRWVRERDSWLAPGFSVLPRDYQLRNTVPALIQKRLLKNAWSLEVEADSGQRMRFKVPDHESAVLLAGRMRSAVEARGVPALAEFA